jgi:hypothetical protein
VVPCARTAQSEATIEDELLGDEVDAHLSNVRTVWT